MNLLTMLIGTVLFALPFALFYFFWVHPLKREIKGLKEQLFLHLRMINALDAEGKIRKVLG